MCMPTPPTRDPARRRRVLVIALVAFLLFDALALAVGARFLMRSRAASAADPAWTADERTVVAHSAPLATSEVGTAKVWRLGGGLDGVEVYDILPLEDGRGAWLGTGLGLVRVSSEGEAIAYRSFPGAPREWVRDLAAIDGDVAASIALAPGNTGGESVGTFVFDPDLEQWARVGPYARELASDGSALYGVEKESLVRFETDAASAEASVRPVVPEVKICREVDLVYAAGALWMTQQDQVRVGPHTSREVPCGVTRVVPDGESESWTQADGLTSGFGRSIVGDDRAVYVSHGIQGDGLSVFDLERGRWTSVRGGSGIRFHANVLGLSPGSVWLGTPNGSAPLVRIDRRSGRAEVVAAAPENHYVSALAGDAEGAWAAWSLKHYEGNTYQVETWVARIRDTRADPALALVH